MQIATILIEMEVASTPAEISDCVFFHFLNCVQHTAQQVRKSYLNLLHIRYFYIFITEFSVERFGKKAC